MHLAASWRKSRLLYILFLGDTISRHPFQCTLLPGYISLYPQTFQRERNLLSATLTASLLVLAAHAKGLWHSCIPSLSTSFLKWATVFLQDPKLFLNKLCIVSASLVFKLTFSAVTMVSSTLGWRVKFKASTTWTWIRQKSSDRQPDVIQVYLLNVLKLKLLMLAHFLSQCVTLKGRGTESIIQHFSCLILPLVKSCFKTKPNFLPSWFCRNLPPWIANTSETVVRIMKLFIMYRRIFRKQMQHGIYINHAWVTA